MDCTKGEWNVEQPAIEPQRFIVDCKLPKEGEKKYHRSICRMFGYCDTVEEELANAQLIASAPDMYEVLKDLLNSERVTLPTGYKMRVEKALAKAEEK